MDENERNQLGLLKKNKRFYRGLILPTSQQQPWASHSNMEYMHILMLNETSVAWRCYASKWTLWT